MVRPIVGLRWLSVLVLAAATAAAGCGGERHAAPQATTVASAAGLRAVEIARGLDRPVHVAAAPGEPGRLYVVGQGGLVGVLEDGRLRDEPFLDVRRLTSTGPKGQPAAEVGLLSLAFAPDYETSGLLYVYLTDRDGDVNVLELLAREGRADPASTRRVLLVDESSPIHNGGQLQFGPDGLLYAGLGDDGLSQVHPQSLEEGDLLGKIVRLDPADPEASLEVVAYGLRNPWRFSFDRETGDLWVGDVGELAWEEVTRLPPSGDDPWNLGWDAYEGHEEVVWDEGGHNDPRGPGELVWPKAVYAREGGCAAVIGGYVYRGTAIPELRGRYLFGDFCTGEIWSIEPDEAGEVRLELELGTTLASFGEDAEGELYLVSRVGRVYRVSG
jgi:glucose/arabinose dehydrogenase